MHHKAAENARQIELLEKTVRHTLTAASVDRHQRDELGQKLSSVLSSRIWRWGALFRAFSDLLARARLLTHPQGALLALRCFGDPVTRRAYRLLKSSPLFDAAYYRATNADVAAADVDPLLHFVVFGASDGRSPHPLFDVRHYLKARPAESAGVNPLADFLSGGWRKGHDPHPLFSTSHYLATNPDVAASGLNPLLHFVTVGWREERSPHPLFDIPFYLAHSPDVAQARINPLEHFVTRGAREKRPVSLLFDADFYLRSNPGVAALNVGPLEHYLTRGWVERRAPHPLFDCSYYLDKQREGEAQTEPVQHYLSVGARAGLSPHPVFDPAWYAAQAGHLREPTLVHYLRDGWRQGLSPHPLFDPDFYIRSNVDVAASGALPLAHFLEWGWREHRAPHPLFDIQYYLEQYPDVAAADVNPLVHFLLTASREARNPNAWFDVRAYTQAQTSPPATQENALIHYARVGGREGRRPSARFDPVFYRNRYADVGPFPGDPLSHFMQIGRHQGRFTSADQMLSYEAWIGRNDTPSTRDVTAIRRHIGSMPDRPRISMLATFRVEAEPHWRALLDVLARQLYEEWELLVVAPESSVSHLEGLVSESLTGRVRIIQDSSVPAVAPLNQAFGASTGSLIAPLAPHRWLPSAQCLYHLAAAAEQDQGVLLFYGDDDRRNRDGVRHSPRFKPEWDEHLQEASAYIGPCVVIRRLAFDELGGFPAEADWVSEDLIWRVAEVASPGGIRHVPYVLSHVAGDEPAVPTVDARPALERHFARCSDTRPIEVLANGSIRAAKALEAWPALTLIMLTRAQTEALQVSVNTLLERTDYPDFRLVIVHHCPNGESSPRSKFLSRLDDARVHLDTWTREFNFSAMNNAVAAQCDDPILGFVNDDMEFADPAWLRRMVSSLMLPKAGIVGTTLYYPSGRVQHAGVIVGKNGVAGHAHAHRYPKEIIDQAAFGAIRQASAVTAACMLTHSHLFAALGGFDEERFPVNLNDIDFCLRARELGYRVLITPTERLVHHESLTRRATGIGLNIGPEGKAFVDRWRDLLQAGDPFYSPNLGLDEDDHVLASIPRIERTWAAFKSTLEEEEEEDTLDPRLQPYRETDNPARAAESTARRCRVFSSRTLSDGVSIVILSKDQPQFVVPLVQALAAARRRHAESGRSLDIIIGDTGSTDPTVLNCYEEHADSLRVIRELPYHFSRTNNEVVERAVYRRTVLFLNNDVAFVDAAASILMLAAALDDSRVAVAGAYLRYPDGSLQHGGIDFFPTGPLQGLCYHPGHGSRLDHVPAAGHSAAVPAVTGACFAMHTDLFFRLGGFDERYQTEAQDAALCLSARRLGYEVRLVSAGEIVHHENGTRPRGSENWTDRRRLTRQWRSFVEALC
ncbi:MAG: glycosyltransferase, partial [Vicinamibacterales bacterium]